MSTTQGPPPTVGIDDAFGRGFVSVRRELADLVDTPTWSLDDKRLDQRIGDVLALKAQVDELAARLVAEADDRNLPHRHGASSTRAHLMTSHRMSAGEASRVVRTAKQLHGTSGLTEPTRRAVAAGTVSAEQGVVVAAAINRLSPSVEPDRVDAAQADLLKHAQALSFTQLQVAANHLVEVIDPEVVDQTLEQQLQRDERDALAGVQLIVQTQPDGTSNGTFRSLPALHTAILRKALDACASPRRTNPILDDGTGDPALPYPSRLGRAFCELIEHLPVDELPQHGMTNPSIVVTVDEDKLRAGAGEATLDTRGAISVGETRRLACNAGLLPMVLSGESKILDLGTSRRLFDRHQRLALATRDQGCVFPGCERPPAWTEAHHRIPWSEGGATNIDNGCLLCSFHHHLIHQGEWELTLAPDGITEVIPPARIDPQRRPIRHQRFKLRSG
ncbi:MAG: DUF222 domain-containing protein, partial [Nocardioidaceae bacterium]